MLFAAIFTQLNPDEQVWKNVKERVAKKFPSDEYEMRSLIREALTRLQEMPEIAREFFDHHELAIPRALAAGIGTRRAELFYLCLGMNSAIRWVI